MALAEAIRGAYRTQIVSGSGRRSAADATDTLVSKVLLATLACAPAFDLYVVKGLRAEGISYSALNARTLTDVFDRYREHRTAVEAVGDLPRCGRDMSRGRGRYGDILPGGRSRR